MSLSDYKERLRAFSLNLENDGKYSFFDKENVSIDYKYIVRHYRDRKTVSIEIHNVNDNHYLDIYEYDYNLLSTFKDLRSEVYKKLLQDIKVNAMLCAYERSQDYRELVDLLHSE